MSEIVATGRCLCGSVEFSVNETLRPVIYCHCDQCRRTSGHFVAATAVAPDALKITCHRGLKWFASSDSAQRGFCHECGSSLFWRPGHGRYVSIMAGCIDEPNNMQAIEHIFVKNFGSYYDVRDGLPQYEEEKPEVN